MSSEESMKTRSTWDLTGQKGYEMNNSPSKNVPSDPVVGEQQRKQRPYNFTDKVVEGYSESKIKFEYCDSQFNVANIRNIKKLKKAKFYIERYQELKEHIKIRPKRLADDKLILFVCTDNIPPEIDLKEDIRLYGDHFGNKHIIQNLVYYRKQIDQKNYEELFYYLNKGRKYDELCYANRDRDLSTHVQDDKRGIKQNHNFVVFDTEGNPLKKEKATDLRELYARKVTIEGKKLEEINLLELDKLEDDKARGKAAGRILELIDQNTIVVAHNIKHDIDILVHYNVYLPECFGYICTAKENYLLKLEEALSEKNIDFEKSDLHHAKYDTEKTIELLFKNLEENRRVTYLYGEEIVNKRYADDK